MIKNTGWDFTHQEVETEVECAGVTSLFSDDLHVIMWDYDGAYPEATVKEKAKGIAQRFDLDVFVLKTPSGFHFFSPQLKTVDQVEEIQRAFHHELSSEYPTIKEILAEDVEAEDEFLGNTLRINPPNSLCCHFAYGDRNGPYSSSHWDVFKLMCGNKDEVGLPFPPAWGNPKEGDVVIVGYTAKKRWYYGKKV